MRVGRTARWVIGLGVAGCFGLVAFAAGFTALASAVAESDGFGGDDYTSRAPATVLDVDRYEDAGDEWTSVDVDFVTGDGERVVTYVDWPVGVTEPEVGDLVDIAYDPADPEWAVEASDAAEAGGEGGDRLVLSDARMRELLIGGGVSGVLALVALVGTIAWAVRAPRPEVRPLPAYPGYARPPAYPGHPPPYPHGAVPPPYPGYPPPYRHAAAPPPPPAQPPAPAPPDPARWPTPH